MKKKVKARRKPNAKDILSCLHRPEFQLIWETPWGDIPGAGLFETIKAAEDYASRPIRECQSLSSKYRVEPVQWPRIWRINPFTGELAYGPPLSLDNARLKRR
jgi:hypothetical protein